MSKNQSKNGYSIEQLSSAFVKTAELIRSHPMQISLEKDSTEAINYKILYWCGVILNEKINDKYVFNNIN